MLVQTICRDCIHHRCKDQDSERANVWYNHWCGALQVQSEGGVDPVTGEIEVTVRRYCRDINKGNCPMFVSIFQHRNLGE
jgi:hypothetical protein